MKRKKHKFLKFIFKIALICLIFYIAFLAVKFKIIRNATEGATWETGGVYSTEEKMKRFPHLYNVPSDIEGYTKADKIRAGLWEEDGSDTDGDGLTDKEEIEVYKTDPLKYSTMGDLYGDKEKLDLGLDLLTYVQKPYSQEDFTKNECPEIEIIPEQKLYDYEIKDVTGGFSLQETTVYKVYECGYVRDDTTLVLDLASFLEENNLKLNDIQIVLGGHYKNRNPEIINVKDVKVKLKSELGIGYIFIVKKDIMNYYNAFAYKSKWLYEVKEDASLGNVIKLRNHY